MFGPFTDEARDVLEEAKALGKRLNRTGLATDQLLIALSQKQGSFPATMLRELGVEASELALELEALNAMIDPCDSVTSNLVTDNIGMDHWTPRVEEVINRAIIAARRLRRKRTEADGIENASTIGLSQSDIENLIGVNDLLLGLIFKGHGRGVRLLTQRGISLDRLKTQCVQLLNERLGYEQVWEDYGGVPASCTNEQTLADYVRGASVVQLAPDLPAEMKSHLESLLRRSEELLRELGPQGVTEYQRTHLLREFQNSASLSDSRQVDEGN
jgi:ATP-dependent Clp protease ATP-binding subunit ClpA